jgi:hypothetical protein
VQNECLQAKSLIRGAVTLRFESSEGSTVSSWFNVQYISCLQSSCSSYRAENLLVGFMTPGPQEPTGSQLQNYLKFIIDNLLKLYEGGVVYHTPSHPQGRRVHVVLLGVICDHPAMCKMCGFADHGHNVAPCPKCKVTKEELFSDESLRNGKSYFNFL